MMRLSQAAQAIGAQQQGADAWFDAVSTDTRHLAPGELFIALRGERFDGAEFVPDALKAGAAGAVVNTDSRGRLLEMLDGNAPLLYVENTRRALGHLATHWRSQFNIPLIAVTGSNGKTTVKEMIAAILQQQAGAAVLATAGNFNNDIGMPLTLLKLRADHRYAVIEMGMNHAGEIDYLSRLARPDVALINNASVAHLQGLGTVTAVAHAKGEIFAGLKPGGTAIINADDPHAPLWRTLAAAHRIVDFALEQEAEVRGTWAARGFGGVLQMQTPAGEARILLQVPGEHNARNALAAAAAALALGASLDAVVRGLEGFGGVTGRLQRKAARHGATLIDDTYNANPASMQAALEVLAQARGRRILVLGDMGELGAETPRFHREAGIAAREFGIERLLAIGPQSADTVAAFGNQGQHFDSVEALCAALETEMGTDTTILVKGSRFMKMERVVQFCALHGEEACCLH